MSALALSLRQVRYTNKAFWRNPASAFFTFVFPLMFLVIFTALLGSGEVDFGHGIVLDQATYFVAAMAAFGVITATYTNIAISVTFQRDQGILKRLRGTPLPSWAYLTARVLHSMLVALVLVVITLVFGKVAYGTRPADRRAEPGVRPHPDRRFALVRGAGDGGHRRDPERGRGAAHRERDDPAAALPVGRLHPDQRRHAGMDQHRQQPVPRQALRRRDARGVPRATCTCRAPPSARSRSSGAIWPSSPCGGSWGSSSRAGSSVGNPASSSGDATLGRRPGRAVIRTGSRG